MTEWIKLLGDEVEDPDEEVFLVFSEPIPSSNLGFISSRAASVRVSVAGQEVEVHQSPGLLSSDAASGTTGAVLWKITPLVAEWLLSADNFLFEREPLLLGSDSHLLELGCGVAGVIATTLGRTGRVGRYIATDLDYVLRGLRKNLVENGALQCVEEEEKKKKKRKTAGKQRPWTLQKSKKHASSCKKSGVDPTGGQVEMMELDWCETVAETIKARIEDPGKLDCILACDCIYNEALVEPFVETCVHLCSLRDNPPVCVIAQQLRSDLVFEAWLKSFHKKFRVWRVPNDLLIESLQSGSGYAIHIGLLRKF